MGSSSGRQVAFDSQAGQDEASDKEAKMTVAATQLTVQPAWKALAAHYQKTQDLQPQGQEANPKRKEVIHKRSLDGTEPYATKKQENGERSLFFNTHH